MAATIAPTPTRAFIERQIFNRPTSTISTPISNQCTPIYLPANGVLSLPSGNITLTTDVLFNPECTGAYVPDVYNNASATGQVRDKFYASVTPQSYVLSAATVIAWMLLIVLVISPRASHLGGSHTGSSVLGGRGFISRVPGRTSVISVGSRPWLQKLAAFSVAVSLTIATCMTFTIAADQYDKGYQNALVIRDKVAGSKQIQITRVISDIIIYLAQVQTLIRLFPRHREKIMIKWIGFALIVLDTLFACLDNFMYNNQNRYGTFTDAVPAIDYLFVLALGLLYAAWVLFYALTKRTYAFYHRRMPNICLVAFMSILAILTPIIFFVADISNQTIDAWGDYLRWVGGAAASVVVWEWVERIEALEREDKRDGILGREIFEEDEVLDRSSSEKGSQKPRSKSSTPDTDRWGHGRTTASSTLVNLSRRVRRPRIRSRRKPGTNDGRHEGSVLGTVISSSTPASGPTHTRPPPTTTPISRTDTTSPGSTVYTVQYRTIQGPTPAQDTLSVIASHQEASPPMPGQEADGVSPSTADGVDGVDLEKNEADATTPPRIRFPVPLPRPFLQQTGQRLQGLLDRARWNHDAPPAEIARATETQAERIVNKSTSPTKHVTVDEPTRPPRTGMLGSAYAARRAVNRSKKPAIHAEPPTIVIPAQPRGRTWSPGTLPLPPEPTQTSRQPPSPHPPPAPGGTSDDAPSS